MNYDVALTEDVNAKATEHLLSFFSTGKLQEDLCFALWTQSTGSSRTTAILTDIILPNEGERLLHGGASFVPSYLSRAVRLAVLEKKGLAFLHSHPSPGWQGMSQPDVVAERDVIAPPTGATKMPLVGLTLGTDGYWSARFWTKTKTAVRCSWCTKVRVIAESRYHLYYYDKLAPRPKRRNVLRRTFDTWGPGAQAEISRLHIGIVGLGSVGAIVAEAVARIGIRDVTLVDHDVVEQHNLDRLLFASEETIGQRKVELAKRLVLNHATADTPRVRAIPSPVHQRAAYNAILDCDLIFSCVDRPVARDVLNYVSQAHMIPVIDGGVAIEVNPQFQTFTSAHWRAHICTPLHKCLRCLGQYSSGMVITELDGSLDNPTYVHNLPDHAVPRNENVFPFSLSAAALQVNLLLRYLLSEPWWPIVHQQDYQFVLSKLQISNGQCHEHCSYNAMYALGDLATPPYLVMGTKTDTEFSLPNGFFAKLSVNVKKLFNFLCNVFRIARR